MGSAGKKKRAKAKGKKEIVARFSGSEVIERRAARFGTGAHVIVPKEYAEKKLKIFLFVELKVSEIIERKAGRFGTGAHVIVPKEYSGRKLKIILEGEYEK